MNNWGELEKEAREILVLDANRTADDWEHIHVYEGEELIHWLKANGERGGMIAHCESSADAKFLFAAPRMAALIRRFLEECKPKNAPNNGWIEWSGGKCPVTPTTEIEVHFRDDTYQFGVGNEYFWSQYGEPDDIIAYRIVEGQP